MTSLASFPSRWLTVALAIVAGLALCPDQAGAADDALRVAPDQISLQSGLTEQKVVIVLPVPAKTTVRTAKLGYIKPDGLEVTASADRSSPQTNDIFWTVEVRARPNLAKDAVVIFVVNYEIESGDPLSVRALVATALAHVTYTGLTLPGSLKVTVEHGFESLISGVPKKAFLVIDNSGVEDVVLEAPIEVVSPADVTVCPCFKDSAGNIKPDCALPTTIHGRTIRRLPVEIEAERASAGASPLLLNLSFSRQVGNERQTALIGVTDPLQVGVPGLSDIKAVMQIPSLLALPGMLVALTWGLIWRLRHQGAGQPEFWLPVREGPFYVVAITLSIVIAYAYSRRVLHETSGLLESVSMRDVARIWFGSIVLGIVSYYGVAWTGLALRTWRQYRIDKYHPKAGEAADIILGKLALNRMSLQLPSYTIGEAGHEQRVFKLDFGAVDDTHCWIVPRIAIRLANPNAHPELGERITIAINAYDVRALQTALEGQTGNYQIGWEGQPPYDGPTSIPIAQLSRPLGRQAVVECT
jgi:hypothetical protein